MSILKELIKGLSDKSKNSIITAREIFKKIWKFV